jgi:hypothetical protein
MSPVKLETKEFPYRIVPVWEVDSYFSAITIKPPRDSPDSWNMRGSGDPTYFYVVNAAFHYQPEKSTGRIEVRHPWAKDSEADGSKYAIFELDSLILGPCYSGEIQFSGWLTEMHFYPEEKPNPFIGAVKKEDPNAEHNGYYLNNGYPYTPPVVSIEKFTLPRKVEISLNIGAGEDFQAWVDRWFINEGKSSAESV